MRVPLSLLKKYIDINLSPEEIAQKLLLAGIEVERIDRLTPHFTGVIVARVVKTSKHPAADKLCIAEVFDGIQHHTVVCGASNCREGLFTAFAPIGAKLFSESMQEIAPCEIRGVRSHGMLCSEEELGFSETVDGIIEFSAEEYPLGQDLAAFCNDIVFELGLTPNLGHAFSVLGVARELAAICNTTLKKQPWQKGAIQGNTKNSYVIERQTAGCPRYSYLHVDTITVSPSPLWLKNILESAHLRSVNTIVDITNLVLLELGQPLHAFDAKKIEGNTIYVRQAFAGEKFELLDGTKKELSVEVMVIADSMKPLACGGIIGGFHSAISEVTTEVVFESAYFTSQAIRKGRKSLGVHTDSAKRFEKGTDPQETMIALAYVQELLSSLAPGARVLSCADSSATFEDTLVLCRRSRTNRVLGADVSTNEMEEAFARYGFSSAWDGQDTFTVKIPPRRHDIQEEIDLIEEISKLRGLVPDEKKAKYSASGLLNQPLFSFEREVRARLIAEGLQECITCDLISPSLANIVIDHPIRREDVVQVVNPTSQEQSVLRPSLIPGLIEVIKRNISFSVFDMAIFELGNIHLKKGNRYTERMMATCALTGQESPYFFDAENRVVDFYSLKGILENLFGSLGFTNIHCTRSEVALFHPGRQAKVMLDGAHIGMIGELHPQVMRSCGLEQRVLFAECDIQDMFELLRKTWKMRPLPQFPGSERDWTFTVAENIPLDEILLAVQGVKSPILEQVFLRTIWRSEKLGADKKNVTLRFYYRDLQKTISQEEVDHAHAQIMAYVAKEFHILV